MKKIFQHRNAVNCLAFLALSLAVFSFVSPKIDSYNEEVKDKQIDLLIQANGTSNGVLSFSGGDSRESSPFYYAEIGFALTIFFSLLLTKRIFFSFFTAALFLFQFVVIHQIFYSAVSFPGSYFLNYPLLSPIFVIGALALSCWQAAVVRHFWCKKFVPEKPFK